LTGQPKNLFLKLILPLSVFAAILLAPTPDGLTNEGQRALAVMGLAVVLWATEALPIAVTGMVGVVILVLVKAVPDVEAALFGFSQPVPYFLMAPRVLAEGRAKVRAAKENSI